MHTGCKNNLLRLFAIPPGQLNCVDNFAGRFLEGYNKSRESEWTWLQNKLFFPQHPVMYILHLCTSIYSLFNSVTDLWWPNWEPDTVAASQLAANPSFPSPPPLFPSPPSPPPFSPSPFPPCPSHTYFFAMFCCCCWQHKEFLRQQDASTVVEMTIFMSEYVTKNSI